MSAELREWEGWEGGVKVFHAHLTVSENAQRAMDREQLEMLADAVFLIRAALRGQTEGPLTLPKTRLPIR